MDDSESTVVIVEDEEKLAERYAEVLEQDYTVKTVYSGGEALEIVDESVDVVLLDRKMPGLSGEEVLEELRQRGYDFPVGMLTAITPDWDILEMEFDDYINKPVEMPELQRLVERLIALGSLDEEVRKYIARSVKQAAIEGEKDPSKLQESSQFDELVEEIAETSTELGDITTELSKRETELVFETITRNLTSADDAGGIGPS